MEATQAITEDGSSKVSPSDDGGGLGIVFATGRVAGDIYRAVPIADEVKAINRQYEFPTVISCPFDSMHHQELAEFDPHVLVGTGGYVSLPIGHAAILLRIQQVIQEQNSVPGIANWILVELVDTVFVAYDAIVDCFPAVEKRKCVVCESPVRPLLRKERSCERSVFPDLDKDRCLGSGTKVLRCCWFLVNC